MYQKEQMKLRIFVIDDEESIRETFQWHLEAEGHEVLVAEEPLICDIYHGCDCREEHPCGDLLFVDYLMPLMTGLEFIEMMHKRGCKGNPANKYIMSGNVNVIDMDRVKEIGCNVIQKPVTLEKIDQIIAEVKPTLAPDRQLNSLEVFQKKAEDYSKKAS